MAAGGRADRRFIRSPGVYSPQAGGISPERDLLFLKQPGVVLQGF